jgi:hypothetical protein
LSNTLAIYYFLKCEFQKDPERWFTVREVASAINLSVDRTRKHLSLLRLGDDAEMKVEGWFNVYRFKNGLVKSIKK